MMGCVPVELQRFYRAPSWLAVVGLLCAGALSACAPALNWREVRGHQAGVVASFPCKPDLHVRQVKLEGLGGAPLPMALRVCDAGEHTFAMTEVDVQDPARVPVVMKNLLIAYAGNVGTQPLAGGRQEWAVKGMTPQPDGGWWRFEGAMPSGQRVQAQTGLVSRGTVIVQVNVSGPMVAPEVAKQFFEGFIFLAP